ncbi:MAG TPA: hypothetical protein PK520_04435 [Exilispira sp.]|nr:hypothetical protein [Exilispira sp.]
MNSNSILNFGSYDFYILWAITFGFLVSFSIFGKEKIKSKKALDFAFNLLLIAFFIVLTLDILALVIPEEFSKLEFSKLLNMSDLKNDSSGELKYSLILVIRVIPLLFILAAWIIGPAAFNIKTFFAQGELKNTDIKDSDDENL